MVIIHLKGGLGNQMFQYAFGRAYGLKHDVEVKYDVFGYGTQNLRAYSLAHFNIKENIANADEVQTIKNPYGIISKAIRFFRFKILREFNLDYSSKIFNSRRDNHYFTGFFQSEKYFFEIKNIILCEFTLIEPLKQETLEVLAKIEEVVESGLVPVSLHIRRGDYVSNAKTNMVHGVCDLEYYDRAIETITNGYPEASFFVFSDDIEWARANLHSSYPMLFVSNRDIPDFEELHLMSVCKHHIIANSSFGWWGAWLDKNEDKIVIAPKRWTNEFPDNHPNIIPSSWIRL